MKWTVLCLDLLGFVAFYLSGLQSHFVICSQMPMAAVWLVARILLVLVAMHRAYRCFVVGTEEGGGWGLLVLLVALSIKLNFIHVAHFIYADSLDET